MLILNRVFAEPFDEAVITKATASADKYFYEKPGKYYTPENYQSKVCGMDSDVNILKYFVRPKRSRKAHKDASEYKRQYYRAKLINDGKRPYSDVLNERYEYIRNYISSNAEYNRAELIKELSALFNVSVRTARRYVETVEEIIKSEEYIEAEVVDTYEATGIDTVEVKSDKINNGQFLDNNTIKIYSYARIEDVADKKAIQFTISDELYSLGYSNQKILYDGTISYANKFLSELFASS